MCDVETVTYNHIAEWKSANADGSGLIVDSNSGLKVLHVNTLQSFIQAAGWLRYKYKRNTVLYRGQSELYVDKIRKRKEGNKLFQPTGYRNQNVANATAEIKAKVNALKQYLQRTAQAKHSDNVLEGMLQQYGIATSWIDAVDNLWIALWFACHKFDTATITGQTYVHPVIRTASRARISSAALKQITEHDQYAYVLILSDYCTEAEVLDLRKEIPSYYLRPHSQHGMLIRCKPKGKSGNMFNLIIGIMRINLEDALNWLGKGEMLTTENLFPSPIYDKGLMELLGAKNSELVFPNYC